MPYAVWRPRKCSVIFFEAALNTSLGSHYINQSALAELISFLTGKKKGTIRTKITEGIGYDGPQEKQDAAYFGRTARRGES